ncbi:calcium-binding protein [Azospirillum palustre]
MSIVIGNVPINLSGSGDTAGVIYDNYYLISQSPSQISFRYTLNSVPVMDVSIGGTLNITDYSASGRITSLTATQPNGTLMLSFSNANLSFSSVYGLANALTSSTILSGNDQIFGSAQSDTLYGYSGNDYIAGGGGNDTINGGTGIDTIDGGDGTDIVISNQYYTPDKLIAFNGQLAVLDRSNGTDLLTNVEYIRFYDRTVAPASATGFDALGYLASNRDLAALGTDEAAAFNHYVQSGYTESRSTSFDAVGYLAANRDLAAAFGTNTVAATRHYITTGRFEGRSSSFNAMSYIAANPDLIRAFGGNTAAAALHYATSGRLEGRATTFNAAAYLARNPDLQRALGGSETAATAHYVAFGYREGRSTTPLTTTGRAASMLASDAPSTLLGAAT